MDRPMYQKLLTECALQIWVEKENTYIYIPRLRVEIGRKGERKIGRALSIGLFHCERPSWGHLHFSSAIQASKLFIGKNWLSLCYCAKKNREKKKKRREGK